MRRAPKRTTSAQRQIQAHVMQIAAQLRERDRLREHFARALAVVGKTDDTALPDALRRARRRNLARLREYRQRGIFPRNFDYPERRTPYFIDPEGRACAVAYLVIADGRDDVASAVHAKHNNAYIAEMSEPLLLAWAAESGFTLDELAVIQPDYCPNNDPCVLGGSNGPGEPCTYYTYPDGTICDPPNACGSAVCQSGYCVHERVDCNDHDECTYDSCDPVTGCQHLAYDPAIDCDDGDPETNDRCDHDIGCISYVPQPTDSGCAFQPPHGPAAWPFVLVAMAVHRLQRRRVVQRIPYLR